MRRRLRHRSSAKSGVQDEWCAVCLDGIVPKAAGWRDSRFRTGIIQRRSGAVISHLPCEPQAALIATGNRAPRDQAWAVVSDIDALSSVSHPCAGGRPKVTIPRVQRLWSHRAHLLVPKSGALTKVATRHDPRGS